MSILVGAALVAAAAVPSSAQTDDPAHRPAAVVRFAPERYDDLMWENDRVAHRIYGPALQAQEPPSGSGVDVWAKKVGWPFMDRLLASGRYHVDQGEGLDFYDVGRSRGAGGLGIWYDDKLWTSRNFRTYEIQATGGDEARFSVTYAPWPVDVDRRVWETRAFSLPLGSHFTRMTSTLESNTAEPLIVGIGVSKHKNAQGSGAVVRDPAKGLLSFREPDDPGHGSLGVAILADPRLVVGYAEDADNYLILLRVTPGEPFVYYMGSAWDRAPDFPTAAAWEAHVAAQTPDFDPQ